MSSAIFRSACVPTLCQQVLHNFPEKLVLTFYKGIGLLRLKISRVKKNFFVILPEITRNYLNRRQMLLHMVSG